MPSVAPDPSAFGCRAAFAALGPGTHEIDEMFPAVRQCTRLAMWIEAFQEFDRVGFSETGVEVLRRVCAEPAVSREPLCAQKDS
jgi:hypothetical protein